MRATEGHRHSGSAGVGFPPIGDYAFLSDCHTAALVASDGAIEWMCLPRFDSPSVFAAILDRGAGHFRFGPRNARVPVARRYVPGTNVLETTWMIDGGWLIVRDALCLRASSDTPRATGKAPHGAGQADSVLIRLAECVHGTVEVEAICAPAFDYGRVPADWGDPEGSTLVATAGDERFRLGGDIVLGIEGDIAHGTRTLEAGESAYCWLSWGEELDGPSEATDAARDLEETAAFWRRWLESGEFPDHPWRPYLQRSALALKGLTYAPTGAIVAAATTSLPETPGGERNWDYRYTWIRDASFALWAAHILGFDREGREFLDFVAGLCGGSGPDTQIMFGIGGESELTEKTLRGLGGYRGARPVRIGNGAFRQRQNDVYGALLDAAYLHTKTLDGVPDRLWEIVSEQVEHAIATWRLPDQGIWETRGEPRHYVSSKLMGWVALERGARLAERRGESAAEARWREQAAEIRAEILELGVSPEGVFRQHYETDALDASSLLVPLVRFLPADDPRVKATVEAIQERLTVDGLVLRYRPEETDDGLGGQLEGSFAICSFWLVSALSEIGERGRARELCGRLLSFASPLGLYAEEIDPLSGAHLGNFPQAFTHLALINAVAHVIADDLAGDREGPSAVFTELR
jgi:GH15 family glucan-1,4-alpha-glucosidase